MKTEPTGERLSVHRGKRLRTATKPAKSPFVSFVVAAFFGIRTSICVAEPQSWRVLKSIHRMLVDIENLLKLQDVDKEIRRLHDEVAELPKRVAVIEQKLAGTKAQLEKAHAAV